MTNNEIDPATVKTHPEPLDRDKADHVNLVRLQPSDAPYLYEQIWTRKLTGQTFEVCCAPLYLYGMSLGDVVEINDSFKFVRVVADGGRVTFRVSLENSGRYSQLVSELKKLGARIEVYSSYYFGVDGVSGLIAQTVAGYLNDSERKGLLHYETSK